MPSQGAYHLLLSDSQPPPKISVSATRSIALLCIWDVKAISSLLRMNGERAMRNHEKVVPVRQYDRYRFGRWEKVRKHLRSLPRR